MEQSKQNQSTEQRNLRNDSFQRPVDGQLGERFGTQSLDAFRQYCEKNAQ